MRCTNSILDLSDLIAYASIPGLSPRNPLIFHSFRFPNTTPIVAPGTCKDPSFRFPPPRFCPSVLLLPYITFFLSCCHYFLSFFVFCEHAPSQHDIILKRSPSQDQFLEASPVNLYLRLFSISVFLWAQNGSSSFLNTSFKSLDSPLFGPQDCVLESLHPLV